MNTRTIREILRLRHLNLSIRRISRSVRASEGGVHNLIRKAEEVGLKWPLPEDLSDRELEELLYPKPEVVCEGKALPDFPYIDRDLIRKGVTRQLLWKEYKEACKKEGKDYYSFKSVQEKPGTQSKKLSASCFMRYAGYTRLCEILGAWRRKNMPPSMRQTHKAGEKCFVDYAGLRVNITDPRTGEMTKAQIFVGVMGASNYIFAEATASQSLPDWLGSHTRMLEFFGGVPEIIVPDNLRSGVSRACRYDPEVNPAYAQWADHYRTVIIPARPYKPRDKAKAENAVQIVERSVPAPIRDEKFFSLPELNKRIKKLVEEANSKPLQKTEGCRV